MLRVTNMIWKYWKINHLILSKAVVTISNEWIKHHINFLSKHEAPDGTFLYSVIISELLTRRRWHKEKLGLSQELWSAGGSVTVWVVSYEFSLRKTLEPLNASLGRRVSQSRVLVTPKETTCWIHEPSWWFPSKWDKEQDAPQVDLNFLAQSMMFYSVLVLKSIEWHQHRPDQDPGTGPICEKGFLSELHSDQGCLTPSANRWVFQLVLCEPLNVGGEEPNMVWVMGLYVCKPEHDLPIWCSLLPPYFFFFF